MSKHTTRRNFLQKLTTGVVGATLLPEVLHAGEQASRIEQLKRIKKFSANDHIQIAVIGAGGMGLADANTAITVPGVKLVAACDLYDGRLADAK
ncbi:MAG TPA: twin-arginine translocation signal domain-containing protein, partial [Chitinophagaceae bacterium]|nr:twin-arginine translocation signal domain-containing protein [Chitinophagaceae bacterium]